ncbi:MAG TPA: VIT1/CCC1 transporter family protein [Candidatus Deferrimicrobium sp.]|nr:VIT1/CCC1 transporter family protein [Candidatus Deferrimicrobium sp.]
MMASQKFDEKTMQSILQAEKDEISEYYIYEKLAKATKDPHNKEVLQHISEEELEHYNFWKKYSERDLKPSRWKLWKYYLISRMFGLTFGIKLMERGERNAQEFYNEIASVIPEAKEILQDEEEHENALIAMLNEEKLQYVGSIVLGLNDALVEITGALAGFTMSLQNTKLIAVTGLITGIAASLSMASSEYLSTKSEGGKRPGRSSLYTGVAYFLTVLLLVFPFFSFNNYYFCLGFTLFNGIFIIFIFNYYISVTKEIPFRKRFFEMACVSLGIAALTFSIGILVRVFFHI